MQIPNAGEKSLGYFKTAAVDASATLASLVGGTIPQGTVRILVTPEVQAVRWRDDGVAPTASSGYPLAAGAELDYTAMGAAPNLRFISVVAGALLNIQLYGLS